MPKTPADARNRHGARASPRSSTASAGGRRVAAIKDELGETMNQYVAVFRDADGLQKAHEIVRRLKEEAPKAAIDDRGTVFNQDVIAAIELGYMLDVRRGDRGRRAGAQGVTRGAVPHRLPGAQRRASGSSTSTSRVNGADVPTVSYSPVTITRWQPEERTYCPCPSTR